MTKFITKTMCVALGLVLCLGSLNAQEYKRAIGQFQPLETAFALEKTKLPVTPHRGTIFDDVEGHEAFEINSPGHVPWTYFNGNPASTYYFDGGTTFPNQGLPMAFMVFKPSGVTPPVGHPAHSGLQYFACFNVPASAGLTNGWIISPEFSEVEASATISFYARSLTVNYGMERFKVSISTTGNNAPGDFGTVISPGNYVQVPDTWTQYTYNLPANTKHVAITCVSSDAFALFIDNITINGVTINVPDDCDAISNLQSEVQGTDVKLTWTAAPNNPTNYKIFDGTSLLGTTTNTQFMARNLSSGNRVLGVEAIYTEECSPVRVTKTVEIKSGLPVKNFHGICIDGTLDLSWEVQQSGFNWLTYSSDFVDPQSGIGFSSGGGAIMTAARFTPSDLADKNVVSGMEIKKFRFAMSKAGISNIGLRIWEGGNSVANPGTLKVQQPIDASNVVDGDWTEIDLTTPYVIDATKELRIGYTATIASSGYPLLFDEGPRVPNKSDLLYAGTWTTAYDALSSKPDANACVKAGIEGDFPDPVRFDIYKDDVKIGEVFPPETTYTQSGLSVTDNNVYSVVALYAENAQSPKSFKTITCAPCQSVSSPTAQIAGNCGAANLTWSSIPSVIGYKVWREGNAPVTITSSPYNETGTYINGTTYTWNIVTICDIGKESEPVTASFTAKCNCNTKINSANATISSSCTSAEINWETVSGTGIKYKITRDSVAIATVEQPPYIDEYAFESGKTYNWEVIPVCANTGEGTSAKASSQCLSITEFANLIGIYPNPASSTITISVPNFAKVEVYNTLGQLKEVVKTNTVDVSEYNTGVYFFKVFDTNNNAVSKLVMIER